MRQEPQICLHLETCQNILQHSQGLGVINTAPEVEKKDPFVNAQSREPRCEYSSVRLPTLQRPRTTKALLWVGQKGDLFGHINPCG